MADGLTSLLAPGRRIEKPTDEHEPDAAEIARGEEVSDAQDDEQQGEDAAGARRGHGGAGAIPAARPQETAKDPASIEGKGRYEVENEEQHVHACEPLSGQHDELRAARSRQRE